ncbi:DUF3027 domain-containing protein [Pseudarthrobacter sp. RMG13]|uniref:DUF3027 domain-containing protein n=1 Tax=Pseudarthrobacter humi TaxID=2952523 RepID=A0ABT1LPY1_9MICC|nr:DUF3027 domain-containing protein [Pseudarthrobacter humi]MCP9000518.1 DUF3027 domain-containing protein [Pseudarthrobacter humi]
MNAEAEQPDTKATETAGPKTEAKRRAGVPVWRTGKPDAFLAAAVGEARTAIEGIAAASDIGAHLAAKSEGDRLVTHLFESKMAGYHGWQWYAVLTRNSRSKVVTVSELGLLPGEESILSPEWVPWAERVRPEDAQSAEEDEPRAAEASAAEPDTSHAEADTPGSEDPDEESEDSEDDEPAGEAD